MSQELVYQKTSRSTVKRKPERATYDLRAIHSLVNASPVLYVSFSPGPEDEFPAILPMIGQMGSYEYPSADVDEPLDCYLHGYVSSRMMNLARSSEKGLPLSIAASKVDGLVLSLTANSHSYNYRSAVLYGYGTIVTDPEEKLWAGELITNSVIHDRYQHTRHPPSAAEMASLAILKVKIISASGKARTGGPHDDKKDLENSDIRGRVWTGVVPCWQQFGDPVAAPSNQVVQVPEHIAAFIHEQNEENKSAALSAAKEDH